MAAYVIVQIEVTDPAQYARYQALTPASLAKYGGRFLVRGGTLEHLEGRWEVPRLVIVEFDSAARAREWYDSPEYREARRVRAGAARVTMTLVAP
ncbi:MAG: DUF1330 domain-containing protein [Candidatus Lambdaproteobacteria bacterium]|nr:DUF1330 domain-containing protein [Candidatus Lambdaproteobacteria bacterium]